MGHYSCHGKKVISVVMAIFLRGGGDHGGNGSHGGNGDGDGGSHNLCQTLTSISL